MYILLLGTTTNGNVCRRLFAIPKTFAAILGIDVEMVRNYATIMAVINEKRAKLDAAAFEAYCNAHLDKLFYGEFKKYYQRYTRYAKDPKHKYCDINCKKGKLCDLVTSNSKDIPTKSKECRKYENDVW